ncbi:MAG: hypothetical protein MZV64_37425 [Ignavibacteriales bacterium]|nr:hypothetical protein [Ignavibacteriales bacterium]
MLLEILTNSHCPLCPSAHISIDSYLQNGQYKDQVTFVYYHMAFPYSDDALYQHNPTDASARNSFYGSFSSTPRGFLMDSFKIIVIQIGRMQLMLSPLNHHHLK